MTIAAFRMQNLGLGVLNKNGHRDGNRDDLVTGTNGELQREMDEILQVKQQ